MILRGSASGKSLNNIGLMVSRGWRILELFDEDN